MPPVQRPGGSRLRALVGLAHPGPSLATVGVALACMCLLAGGWPPAGPLGLVAGMLTCQQCAISLHNDWCDRALDAASKPWRAIPSGSAGEGQLHLAAWLLAALSLELAWPLGLVEVLLNAVGLAAGFAYNARLKRTALSWLPFAVAFPLLPSFGAAALWGRAVWSPAMALGVLPAVLAVHLADSLPDLESDRRAAAGGLAARLGRQGTRLAALVSLAAAAAALIWLGVARGPALAGGATGLLLAALAGGWPRGQRALVTSGAAAIGLGWVWLLAT